ncbi:MAG: serine hydrolase [Muricauda sp.]|nr:serine hydrolase [Allomuricauda sp.]MBC32300.1 serine hydrolase [Allomuricauda sp.]|tara:strand:- start:6257 stop:7756 length:1500 start_codon:yes stop_codon:yes gene_type:complete
MKKSVFLIAAMLFLSSISLAQTDKAQQLDAMIQQGMEHWQIPGLAAVVVKNGEIVFQKTYGVKNLETKESVDEHTLFNMGSTTKAMVCMALGILVDQGKLNWTDRVRQHLPYFRLSDSYITEEARVQDLLTHNLGINGADLLWFIDHASTKETIERFAMAEKGYPVRGGYAYNNLMYAVAGEVIQAVSGQHWTDFVGEHLFKPIGMVDAVAKVSEVFGQGNYVTPYLDHIEDGMVQVDYNRSDQIGAAGMIWASASDVANYLKFLDNDGIVGQDTLLKKETFDYLFKPHAFVTDTGFYPTQQLTNPNWKTYGLGWFQHDYRGQKLDFHTGSITGLVAMAGLMRDKDVAVYVFANLDHAELRHAILYKAIDLFAFDDISRGWHKQISQLYGDFKSQNKMRLAKMKEERAKDTNTTLPLTAYEGSYHHTMLGEVSVKIDGDGLLLVFNDFLKLEGKHWHYDTFVSTKNNPYYLETLFQFHLNPQGEVAVLEAFGEHFLKRQ